jgi:hypothetical protein
MMLLIEVEAFFFSPPSIQDYRLLDINWYFTVIILLVLHCLCCLVLISFTNCFSSQVSHHPPMSVGHVENEHFIYDISSKVKTKFFRELSRRLSSWKVNLFCYNCVQKFHYLINCRTQWYKILDFTLMCVATTYLSCFHCLYYSFWRKPRHNTSY